MGQHVVELPECGAARGGPRATRVGAPQLFRSRTVAAQIGEHLPEQAKIMDKFSVVRSAYHTNAGHGMGSQWMQTGYQATIEVNDNIFPSTGAVVAKLKGANEPGLPAYVNLPRKVSFGNAAYLGASYNPFSPDANPTDPSFQVKNLKLPGKVTAERLEARKKLVSDIDTIRRDIDLKGDVAGLDTFYRDALEMVTNTKAQAAFDVNKEPVKLRDRYGRNDLGQCCLLARRLVEAGVPFITVNDGGWDHHTDIFGTLTKRLPGWDQSVAALISDLEDRGMLDSTMVIALGEFGRTPKISTLSGQSKAGRDHWANAMSVLFAGGGTPGGTVVGATDRKGYAANERVLAPENFVSTVYTKLGIDPNKIVYNAQGRPAQKVYGT